MLGAIACEVPNKIAAAGVASLAILAGLLVTGNTGL